MKKGSYDLYGGKPPHVADDGTSEEAAERIESVAHSKRRKILAYIRSKTLYGATCDEVEKALEYRHQTASARIRELVLTDKVFDSGLMRKTRSGRRAHVWICRRPAHRRGTS